MRLTLILIFLIAFISPILSQNVISGTVVDNNDEPLIGVNVYAKEKPNQDFIGTITDFDGKFSLNMPSYTDTLVFSAIGFDTYEIVLDGRTELNIVMGESTTQIEEIVVVGYGVQKKRLSTGAISRIKSDAIEGIQAYDVQSALEGQIPGLIVNESSGQPGADKSILIRGVGTNGNNSPLYIVDGLQVDNINSINPSDIESIDVLKDAASTAIYGARAANGAIIITTKKGTDGEGFINYESTFSVSNPWKLPEMLNASQYIELTREKFENGNQLSSLETLGFPDVGAQTPNTNWMDVLFEPANLQSHKLSATGKNSFLSLEYWDQKGVIGGDKSNYKRYSARVNLSKDINEYVTIGENFYVNRTDNQTIGVNDAFGTSLADAFAYDPITPVNDETKDFGFAQSDWVKKEYINPLSRLFIGNNQGHRDQILGNAYIQIKPLEGLKFQSDIGIDYDWWNWRTFEPAYSFHDAFTNVANGVSQGYATHTTLQVENYLNYEKAFGLHDFNIVVGTSYRQYEGEHAGGSSSFIPDAVQFDENWQFVDAGEDSTQLAFGWGHVDYRLISYYGRVIYNYDGKYLFSSTLRRDGSSNFGANNRWGVFPSFSLGWVVSNEPFFNYSPISFLKIRGSWGINGNDRIPELSFASTVENVFTYPFGPGSSVITGAALATPPNPNIKWEESEQLDLGIELRMFDDKFLAEFDYYVKTTKDLLMDQLIPGYLGATNNPTSNLGEIQNIGFESKLTYRFKIGDFRFSANLNHSTFKNEVKIVAGETGFLTGYGWPVRNTPITRMSEGFPVGHFVGYKTDGIFRTEDDVSRHFNSDGDLLQPRAKPGDIKFIDVNGDGVINSEDITDIGSPWPDHVIGASLNASFKGFDFSVVLSTQLGHDLFRAYERSDVTFTNYQSFWLDRWTPDNPDGEYPRLVSTDPNNNQRPSDFYVEDGSFLRLKNLQIGYNLPKELLHKIKLKGARIYLTGNNLFTVTGYNGFDPDIGTNGWILDTGIDKGYYPSNKTIGGGINITL